MKLSGCNIGFAITGSFCTFDKVISQIEILKDEGANIIPIFSFHAYNLDTRFGSAKEYVSKIETMTGNPAINTIQQAEPIGPGKLLDCLLIAPCTGNTIAKLATGITDTPVLMAAKAHMRNNRPLIIAISSNDALGINFQNIGKLMLIKNVFFVPFGQDHYETKPNSLVADLRRIKETLEAALDRQQLQPLFYESVK
ncbi:MAG: dipicolinate synthase subunit B [Eubacteriales bacterium]|nr:dipicolinate synthase subunit B [Lachnospiraceae bacterium]MDO5127980.1 dipicolinate synthase subunit B [Eubacteriales bacterium]